MDRKFIEQERRYKRMMTESIVCQYAATVLALHRRYGFGFIRNSRILEDIGTLWAEHSAAELRQMCSDETGIDIMSEVTAKEYEVQGDRYVKRGGK